MKPLCSSLRAARANARANTGPRISIAWGERERRLLAALVRGVAEYDWSIREIEAFLETDRAAWRHRRVRSSARLRVVGSFGIPGCQAWLGVERLDHTT